jgi:DNA repair exonuclease SbcCD nuclease subunit
MKICIFSDVHWSKNSSLITQRGEKYSLRLERLIKSLNFINKRAKENNCELMICAGDFFDKPILNDEEITALKEIDWLDIPTYFLCGNHESAQLDLKYSTLNTLISNNHNIISEPTKLSGKNWQIYLLPYITERQRKPFNEYLQLKEDNKNCIVFTHSDIQGYIEAIKDIGFSINEIEQNCDLCFNGHLHNGGKLSNKVINIGSISANNFTNDSDTYNYGFLILDTDTLHYEFITNPFSFNFYKFTIKNDLQVNQLKKYPKYSFIDITLKDREFLEDTKLELDRLDNIISYKIKIDEDKKPIEEEIVDSENKSKSYKERWLEFAKKYYTEEKLKVILEKFNADTI